MDLIAHPLQLRSQKKENVAAVIDE